MWCWHPDMHRCALAAAALVEVDNAVLRRVKEAPLFGVGTASRTSVQKDNRLPRRISAFRTEVDLVEGRDPQPTHVVGFKRRIEPSNRILRHGFGEAVIGHAPARLYIAR